MYDKFIVYVIVDDDGYEIDRYFHENDAKNAVDFLNHLNGRDRYSIVYRHVIYSE